MKDDDAMLFRMNGSRWDAVLKRATEEPAPFYLFHESRMAENIQALRRRLGCSIRIAYAVKANPWLARAAAGEADFLEICSLKELASCQRDAVSPKQLTVDGVSWPDDFLKTALRMGCTRFCVDSSQQLERLLYTAGGVPLQVLLRVTSGNQFGMDREELRVCLHTAENQAVRVQGIQYYPGTQRTDLRRVQRDLDHIKNWIAVWKELTSSPPEEVEFGAGIGVPYFEGEKPEEYARLLDVIAEWARPLSNCCRITYEAGRLLAASCGIYVTEIFAKKQRRDHMYLFCKGGSNHLCYPGGILGVRTPLQRVLCAHPTGRPARCSVYGPLCSESDVLIDRKSVV